MNAFFKPTTPQSADMGSGMRRNDGQNPIAKLLDTTAPQARKPQPKAATSA
ncbi:MAG: hypothetical protein ACREO8_04220 [Luteimonas sp.]